MGPAPSSTPAAGPAPPAISAPPRGAIRASLRYSILDGVAWSVMIGAGERYVQPFVILGGSGLFRLAAITALPALAGALIQWLGANLTDAVGRRKPIFMWSAFVQALTWLPICIAIFLSQPWDYALMLVAFVFYVSLGYFGVSPWNSVMGDLVPAERRGRYFGLRSMLVGSSTVLSFLGAGWWLAYCRDTPGLALLGLPGQQFGFLTLFALAGVARLFSAWYLSRMYEPAYHPRPSDRFSLWEFIRRAPRAHFGRFVFYCMLIQAGVGMVTPFFNWYMLDQLGFSTIGFAWVGTVQMLALYGFSPLVGRLSDRFGSKRVLGAGGLGLVATPLLLMASSDFYYLLAVQVYDGLAWAAFTIAAANYLFDIVTPGKRARCTAYNALFTTLGIALGTFSGAAAGALPHLPWTLAGLAIRQPFTLILVCSIILRLLPNLLLLRSFQEWRLRPLPGPEAATSPAGAGDFPA